jgi:hypothetical protein
MAFSSRVKKMGTTHYNVYIIIPLHFAMLNYMLTDIVYLKKGWCFSLNLRCQQSNKLEICYIFSVYKILNKNTFKVLFSSIAVKITFSFEVNWWFWNKTTIKVFSCFNRSLCSTSLSLGARAAPNAQKSTVVPPYTNHLICGPEYKVLHIVREVKWGILKCHDTIYSSNDCICKHYHLFGVLFINYHFEI